MRLNHIRSVGAFLLLALLPALQAQAQEAGGKTIFKYSIDLPSTYVFRGDDVFKTAYSSKNAGKETAFNVSPAVQPTFTFYTPSGVGFVVWGSFALTDRDTPGLGVARGGGTTGGLSDFDELDTTLNYTWENKMGSYEVGVVNYHQMGYFKGTHEMYLLWKLAWLEDLGPTLGLYNDAENSSSYSTLSVGGGTDFTWKVLLGEKHFMDTNNYSHAGLYEATVTLGYNLGEGFGVALAAANRPSMALHGYPQPTTQPGTVAWLTLSYAQEVKE